MVYSKQVGLLVKVNFLVNQSKMTQIREPYKTLKTFLPPIKRLIVLAIINPI